MSTINANIATKSFFTFTAKPENSVGLGTITPRLTDLFDEIDKKTEARKNDTVKFSSEGQFKINIQNYAFSLSDEERSQFVDALEQSGDKTFDEKFLNNLRNPGWPKNIKLVVSQEMQAQMEASIIGKKGIEHPEIIVDYSKMHSIGPFSFQPVSRYGEIHDIDHLSSRLDKLNNKAAEQLSKQDLVTLAGSMDNAVKASRNKLNSTYSLFRTNYEYEVAEKAIDLLPLGDGLKKDYKAFLSDIKNFQNNQITKSIADLEKKIDKLPQFRKTIEKELQSTKEGLRINMQLQEALAHSRSGLLGTGNEKYFQMLIDKSESINKDITIPEDLFHIIGSTYGLSNENKTVSQMFDYYRGEFENFENHIANKGLTVEQQASGDPVIDQAFEETQMLSKQYIQAITTYMSVSEL